MEKFNTNTVVIGAGVVGLAIAKEISAKNNEVIIIEKEGKIGQITSSSLFKSSFVNYVRPIRFDRFHYTTG